MLSLIKKKKGENKSKLQFLEECHKDEPSKSLIQKTPNPLKKPESKSKPSKQLVLVNYTEYCIWS